MDKPDEMDLSRADAQRRREEDPLFCPCCGGQAAIQTFFGQQFPNRVKCINPICGIATPLVTTQYLAVLIWNRRVSRKPAAKPLNICIECNELVTDMSHLCQRADCPQCLVDSTETVRHTRQSNARKRGASSDAGGSQRNRPKRMRKSKVKESK